LEKAGYEIVNIPVIPYLSEARQAHSLSIISDMASALKGNVTGMNAANRILMTVASQTPAIDFTAANQIRSMIMSQFAQIWKNHPGLIIVTPVVPVVGVELNEKHLAYGVSAGDRSIEIMKYVFLANFIGTPSINALVGYDPQTKLPISLMGTAEWGKDEDLLGFVSDVVRSSGVQRIRPDNWVDALDSSK